MEGLSNSHLLTRSDNIFLKTSSDHQETVAPPWKYKNAKIWGVMFLLEVEVSFRFLDILVRVTHKHITKKDVKQQKTSQIRSRDGLQVDQQKGEPMSFKGGNGPRICF